MSHNQGSSSVSSVTELLLEWRDGHVEALDVLTPLIYDELHRLAHSYMRREASGHLLQTTALVHETYLRLVGETVDWEGREHFFAIAATVMRRVLVDYARRRRAEKRGGRTEKLSLEEVEELPANLASEPDMEILALDECLEKLSAVDLRKCRIIELRFFGGMTIEETARALGISHATVERELKVAKAWLSQALD